MYEHESFSPFRRANAAEWGSLEDSARDELIDRALIANKSSDFGGRFEELPFGATEVFPRLKVATGRRRVAALPSSVVGGGGGGAASLVDDAGGSQGEDIDSASSTSVSAICIANHKRSQLLDRLFVQKGIISVTCHSQ